MGSLLMSIVMDALKDFRSALVAEIQAMDLSQDERDAYNAGRMMGLIDLVTDLYVKFGDEKTVDVRRELFPLLSIACADIVDELEGK